MDQLNRVQSYFNERERRRLDKKVKDSGSAFPDMTPEEVKLSCLENNGYETPELNDKLYLHFRGFRKIENLDPYTGCKSIWLDSNGFDTIEGLGKLVELRCLYLGKNLISKISGLETLAQLTILDLSNNRLTRIENLSCCPNLQTVNVAYNSLATPDSISHFQECKALTNLDITNNRLETNEAFIDTLKAIPALVTLSINGNEVTKLPTFRKRLLGHMPKLGYLDRPVEEHERFYANAFMAGGAEAEAAAREQWKLMQQEKKQAEMEQQRRWQEEQRQLREQAKAEGRSLIREFTAEEQEERRREADAAREAERRMLDLGLGRLGAKVYQLESAGAGGDLLEQAADAIYREEARLEAAKLAEKADKEEEDNDSEEVPIHILEDDSKPSQSTASASAVEEETTLPPVVATESETAAVLPPQPPSAEEEEEEETYEQRMERQNRIDESFAIYKKQQEDLKRGVSSQSTYTPVHTWSAAPSIAKKENMASAANQPQGPSAQSQAAKEEEDMKRPIFWTEVMDLALARQVQLQLFDFDVIAQEMQTLAKQNFLNSERMHRHPELLTVETCRLRWMELDAQHWCELAPGVSAADTIFRVNVSEEILAAGYQPSFDELMQMTASSKPKYLKTPTVLPTMPSYHNDSEEEKDEEDEDGQIRIFRAEEVTMATAAVMSQRSMQSTMRVQMRSSTTTTTTTVTIVDERLIESKEAPVFEMGLD